MEQKTPLGRQITLATAATVAILVALLVVAPVLA